MRKVLSFFLAVLFITGISQAKERNVKITNEMIYQKLIDIDKRLAILETQFRDFKEETNKRFDHFIQFLWIITGIFTTLTVFVIGFAYWDRRILQYPLKEIQCLV